MRKISGVWTGGDYKTRPLTFKDTSVIINWSYYEIKMELLWDENDTEMIVKFYDELVNYGEWGEELIKPICWMMLETENQFFKKNYISKKELLDFCSKSKFFKMTIFFETTIQESPFNSNYLLDNSYWISCIGGLYYIADLYLFVETEQSIIHQEIYKNNKSCFDVKDYTKENMHEYAKETAETAKDLIRNGEGFTFKFNYYDKGEPI